MRGALALASLLAASLIGAPAQAERMVISISRHQVLVTSSFTGTSIVLFGTIEPDTPSGRRSASAYDLVVTMIGPRETAVMRRKERVLGIWANVASRNFVNVPSYLVVLSNKPFAEITDANTLRRLQIGHDYFSLPQQIGPDVADVVRDDPMRLNFIRLQKEHGLYAERTNGVTFLTPTVFRAEIPVPALAPFGAYDVQVRLFAGGNQLTQSNTAFEVVKVGFEQFIANSARDYGLLYGIATVMMAMLTGWFASVVFRKD